LSFLAELVNEVKMKLHGLRTSFGHQLKLESSNVNEMEKEETSFQSKWQWYNQLSFLKETMVFRSTTNNNHSPSDSPPPPMEHGHGPMAHMGSSTGSLGHINEDSDVKMELNGPINVIFPMN
jgi:hypothetical protein